MADFSFLSDTDDSAVEELISEAKDLCVLEQVSAINCSSFTDSVLPSDLDSRFRKLKSFPLATKPKSKPKFSSPPPYENTHFNNNNSSKRDTEEDDDAAIFSPAKQNPDEKTGSSPKSRSGYLHPSDFSMENRSFSPLKENPDGKSGLEAKLKHGSVSSPSNSSNSSLENAAFSASKRNPDEKKRAKLKSKSRSFSSPMGSSNSFMDSPSPPKKAGCFWCSPKKTSQKKSKENEAIDIGLDWGNNDEFLSDLATFSTKAQQKRLKKAMKEEEKISREAEKIVKWAKHASARMSVSGIEDELSDDCSTK